MPRDPVTYPTAWPAWSLARQTGVVELAVGEAVNDTSARPHRVTALLAAMLSHVDGQPSTQGLIRSLSMGTREWLLQQLAALCRPAEDWYDLKCLGCDVGIDMVLDLSALPRTDPGGSFPVAEIRVSGRHLRFELPNGFHEEALADRGLTGLAALEHLLSACLLDGDLSDLDAADLDAIDAALDAAAPDCSDCVTLTCPDCGATQTARIDPMRYAFPGETAVLREVHLLGRSYRWHEADILSMPSRRRQTYVRMITTQERIR
ncbi:hypothetical protein [Palleronia caenipelagi]|uniref:Uncharacterized protein n=1 Tax=Palleronia caenipelagi TaxID=2489174 RepID=A0A547PPP9_9RHOB|nr:hypothetical protein [Palleronia caenipelagi]TRD16116.1 hypothetical protein FEV53_14625 [Palleronia caenipelagi]